MARRVSTHLMFEGDATAALELYAGIFGGFVVQNVERYQAGEAGPEGMVKQAQVLFNEHALIIIDSPIKHGFTFTPAISLFVECVSLEELEEVFGKLSEGGQVFMPLGNYGFSTRFGWCSDRFGVSWQLNLP